MQQGQTLETDRQADPPIMGLLLLEPVATCASTSAATMNLISLLHPNLAQRLFREGMVVKQRPVFCDAPQGSMLGPARLNIFTSDLDETWFIPIQHNRLFRWALCSHWFCSPLGKGTKHKSVWKGYRLWWSSARRELGAHGEGSPLLAVYTHQALSLELWGTSPKIGTTNSVKNGGKQTHTLLLILNLHRP